MARYASRAQIRPSRCASSSCSRRLAVVDTGSGMEEVSVALVSAGVGDEILVHAKEAIAVLGSPEGDTESGTEEATDRVPE